VAFLDLRRVSKTYRLPQGGLRPALRDVSLAVGAGEFAVVLGPSGCGKTTLLRLVARLDREYDGDIRLADSRIGVVFQEPRLLPWMTAGDNVRFVLDRLTGDAERTIHEWLARVGLAAFASAYPHQLSVGMQQRIALARAFAVRPRLLLLDEPFSALDEVTALRVSEHLGMLWHEERPTVLMVTHRVEEAVLLADQIWVLTSSPGRVFTSWQVALPRPRLRGPAFWAEVERLRTALVEAAALPAGEAVPPADVGSYENAPAG
jgi:ABC-type nitrate/sulfonate/bicarbonate transport system ATPase subunit